MSNTREQVITRAGLDIGSQVAQELTYDRWMGSEGNSHPIDGDATYRIRAGGITN